MGEMLVQAYLRSGKTLDDLTTEFGVKVNHHLTDPRVILNYCQINSPKNNPIVRECRGLVLDSTDWSLVARSFPRFFNFGEFPDEEKGFRWDSCKVTEKVDGSLILYYYYRDQWRVNTRNSFGDGEVNGSGKSWSDLFYEALPVGVRFDKSLTYIMELCSPYNKVVRHYPEPELFLLGIFQGEKELDLDDYFTAETSRQNALSLSGTNSALADGPG